MDNTVYDKLYNAVEAALTDFNEQHDYTVGLAHVSPNKPKYPLVIFYENRNQPRTRYYGSRERVSSLGYTVDIFAKDIGEVSKQMICRDIMQFLVDYLQNEIGLNLISNTPFDRESTQGALYRIVLVFQKPYYENKEYFF